MGKRKKRTKILNHSNTDNVELSDDEALQILCGLIDELRKERLRAWMRMVDEGLYKTLECDQIWHETFYYTNLLDDLQKNKR